MSLSVVKKQAPQTATKTPKAKKSQSKRGTVYHEAVSQNADVILQLKKQIEDLTAAKKALESSLIDEAREIWRRDIAMGRTPINCKLIGETGNLTVINGATPKAMSEDMVDRAMRLGPHFSKYFRAECQAKVICDPDVLAGVLEKAGLDPDEYILREDVVKPSGFARDQLAYEYSTLSENVRSELLDLLEAGFASPQVKKAR